MFLLDLQKYAMINHSCLVNKVEKLLEHSQWSRKEEFDRVKYAGAIRLGKYPLEYQQEIRGEW